MARRRIRRVGRRRSSVLATLIIGAILMPIVCGVTFFGLVVSTQAMFGASQPGFEQALVAALTRSGLLPTSTPAASPTDVQAASPTPVGWSEQAAAGTAAANLIPAYPTPDASATAVASTSPTTTATPTATATETATPTGTATSTPTPSPTPSSTYTSTPTWTPWPTATNTSPPPPSNTPAPSSTPSPSPTAGPSPTPSNTVPPTTAPSPTPAECDAAANTGYEVTILSLINDERQSQGLGSLQAQSQLRAAARVQATDMACNHFTGHTGSDGSSVRDRVEAQGYTWSWIGENYMVTSQGPQAAFDWWMNSQPHRDNIRGASYTQAGVGVIYSPDSDYGTYYVVVFARPG